MPDWKHRQLSEVCDFGIGGTPSRSNPSLWAERPHGWPWLSIADLKNKYVEDSEEHISNAGASSSNAKLIPAGTTVMSFKLTVGRTAILTSPMFCNEAIAYFKPKEAHVDSRWLYHELPRASRRVITDTAVKGSTLNKQKIAQIPLDLPPIEEQRQIARILDALDTQIHWTEALIAKLEQIKNGLLTDLLTRGIDENGKLRASLNQAPNLYKDSAVGRVPRNWDVLQLNHLCTKITDGTHQAVSTVSPSTQTVPFLFVSCIRNGRINWGRAAAITRDDFRGISQGRPPIQGMVLYTAVGSYGHAAVVETDREFSFQRHVACIYPNTLRVRGEFIALYLNSSMARQHADRIAIGNAQKTITLGSLAEFPLATPSITEQDRILDAIREHEKRVSSERAIAKKLRAQKQGLEDDLLSGRVRVPPVLGETDRAAI